MANLLDRLSNAYFTPRAGMFREYHGTGCLLEPADKVLYRSLLPEPFEVHGEPLVYVFVVDYTRVVPWPMGPYLEASVALRSSFRGEAGWHVLTMPVTEKLPMQGGRSMGFPKYIADQIKLEQAGEGWMGELSHGGAVRLRLEFTPGLTRELVPWQEALYGDPAFFRDVCHLLLPPGEGPAGVRVRFDHRVPPKWSPVMGMVRLAVDPSAPWAGLVPDGTVAPGWFSRFEGGTNLAPEALQAAAG